MLSLEERKLLLTIARGAVESYLKDRTVPPGPEGLTEQLKQVRGAFVTLTISGRLRGCIGTFRSDEPLWTVVQQMVLSAAFSDPRFSPLEADELQHVHFEISALTPLTRVDSADEITVGTHGLYITRGSHSGVLLPQVAVEYDWDKEQFLEHTCRKAGLPADAWLQSGTTIEVFCAEVFSETDLEGTRVSCA